MQGTLPRLRRLSCPRPPPVAEMCQSNEEPNVFLLRSSRSVQKSIFSYKVDCIWDKWQVGECSKSCDGGKRQITRIRKVEASYGGYDCEGPSNITESCNVEGCPGGINQAKSLLNLVALMK